jgi:hypothetical protein
MAAGNSQIRQCPGQGGGAASTGAADDQAQGQQTPDTGCAWNRQIRLHKSGRYGSQRWIPEKDQNHPDPGAKE